MKKKALKRLCSEGEQSDRFVGRGERLTERSFLFAARFVRNGSISDFLILYS